jgi:hypothetical protein
MVPPPPSKKPKKRTGPQWLVLISSAGHGRVDSTWAITCFCSALIGSETRILFWLTSDKPRKKTSRPDACPLLCTTAEKDYACRPTTWNCIGAKMRRQKSDF